jgi:hypothetical protein
MAITRVELIESALSALIDALARLLIPLDITPARLSQISRSSFVKAAAAHARKRSSGRPHLAKIAALTGLSRTEVKRIVLTNFSVDNPSSECWPRALRVLEAWKTTSRYSSRGKPRQLAISGPNRSFASLCRSYSGDIPHRVILNELERTSRVTVNQQRTRVSVVSPSARRIAEAKSAQALEYAASFLSLALHDDAVLVRRKQRVQTSSSVPTAYVEQAISGRVTELLDQMPELFPRAKGQSRNSVSVFALVARNPKSKKV